MIVYALACFRAGFDEVEVVYLEAPEDEVSSTFSRADVDALEHELGAAIARIREETPADAQPVRLLRLPGAGFASARGRASAARRTARRRRS